RTTTSHHSGMRALRSRKLHLTMRAFDILCVAIVALSLGLAFVEGALEVSGREARDRRRGWGSEGGREVRCEGERLIAEEHEYSHLIVRPRKPDLPFQAL